MSAPPRDRQGLQVIDADGYGLALTFHRQQDRYRHEIALVTPAGPVPWLESIESSDAIAWPDSPPFQELSLEWQNDRQVALLVGMAGKSYWSASIETNAATRSLRFDIACRLREPPQKLGNTYRFAWPPAQDSPYPEQPAISATAVSAPAPSASRSPMVWHVASAPPDLLAAGQPPKQSGLSGIDSCVLRISDENAHCERRENDSLIAIVPRTITPTSATTIRWQYEFSWEGLASCNQKTDSNKRP
ncbi:MAG: hypothetical protein RIS70_4135 [Planctomycetota bacterium]